MTRLPVKSIAFAILASVGVNAEAFAEVDPYEALGKFITVNPADTENGFCVITAVADFDEYKPYLSLFREAWLDRDYTKDFYQQRGKQVFVYIVLKRFSEALTEGLYRKNKDRDCTFYVDISYFDALGKKQNIHGISWQFTAKRANEVDWDHLSYPLIFSRAQMQLEVGASLRRFSHDES